MNDVIKTLRARLVPLGTKPLVRLELKAATYVDESLIKEAIDELEKLPLMLMLDDEAKPSALQRIAILVLSDSAYL